MAKKTILFAIGTWAAVFLLLLFVQMIVGDVSSLFYRDHDAVLIEVIKDGSADDKLLLATMSGKDVTIYYLSPEDQTVGTYSTHVDDNNEMFEQWRQLSGLPEDVALDNMEIESGYEQELDYGNSKILQYVSISPIIQCDLTGKDYLSSRADLDALIDTWAQTIREDWGSELGSLTISVEGEVVYCK